MEPTLGVNQIVVASVLKQPKIGDIVVARLHGDREVIKRLSTATGTGQRFSLVGDNPAQSTNYKASEVAELYGGLLWPK